MDKRMTQPEIAELVLYYRKQSGLTQQELANLAGVGKTVRAYEIVICPEGERVRLIVAKGVLE